jgi:multiple antibiotic resistance protein
VRFLVALLQSTAALLIVLDPLGLVPVVVVLTRPLKEDERRRVLTRAVLTGLAMLLAFTFAGTAILSLFGVTLDDLRIAGGILLLVLALSLVLSGRLSSEPTPEGNVGIVPIATPLLVGPGAITASVVLVAASGVLIAFLSVVIACAVTWAILRATPTLYRILGETGSDIIARIMGILLAAIAVGYVREGIMGVLRATGVG